MDVKKAHLVVTLLKLVEHRDQRYRYADSLEEPRRELERNHADAVLRDKFDEFVEAMRHVDIE